MAPELTAHQRRSSLAADGRRLKVRIGDVSGFFSSWRRRAFWVLMAIYAIAPLIKVHGKPLIFLDIERRHFYLWGQTFNAQDTYLLFYFLAGGLLALFLATSLLGRIWCGWGCPQTVFLEGLFRPIERWVEGPKHEQLALARAPWSWRKARKLIAKHALYAVAALFVTHIFISYFVSFDQLRLWVLGDPLEHWTAFVWMACLTGLLYFNFTWFREQTCLILCPYGRLQSALTDDDSVTVGYDQARGEPRGTRGTHGAGACVDCLRCVDVCPTGIDIREGLQLDCIACTNCIDACDDIMLKLGRAPGLVRYDSLNGFAGKPKRWLRPRVLAYIGIWTLLMSVGVAAAVQRRPFEATLMHQTGAPFVLDRGRIRNAYVIHLVNKTRDRADFSISLDLPAGATAVIPMPTVTLDSLADIRLPILVEMEQAGFKGEFDVVSKAKNLQSGQVVESHLRFLAP